MKALQHALPIFAALLAMASANAQTLVPVLETSTTKVTLTSDQNARCFQATATKAGTPTIIYGVNISKDGYIGITGNRIFYSIDGKKFYELFETGRQGTIDQHILTFEDPNKVTKESRWERNNDSINFGGKTFSRATCPKTINAAELTSKWTGISLFKVDKQFIYLDYDLYHGYTTVRVYIGASGRPLKPINVTDVNPQSGTIQVVISDKTSTINVPKGTWAELTLTKLSLKEYRISGINNVITITKL
jgi:hypothetical protein